MPANPHRVVFQPLARGFPLADEEEEEFIEMIPFQKRGTMLKISCVIIFSTGTTMKKTKIGLISAAAGRLSTRYRCCRQKQKFGNLDRERYQPLLIYINRVGEWCLTANSGFNEES
jgi:hypothetical protein